ncbi:hypothetical protein ABID70_002504 [Clavibacter michiganensis]|uniref:hypothetical protein n=1 Tax=Clavibacter michiganensis TaxID=28447 RepID=UPI001AE4577D|nr:hypothetical protein [Clavibacter michiganensis]MBP2456980.1 hypothetical protein [Clavibacter michiganensis]MDQ0409550.1 hypothetical protein [Clavibacter michiganensis]
MDWSVAGLRGAGFEGFVPFDRAVEDAPETSGVYVVVRPDLAPPVFLPVSPAGRFTGRNPSYPPERLAAEWVAGSEVVYLGKAGRAPGSRRGLRARLREYAAFGSGKAIAHRGGRAIWHLGDSAQLLVAWRETAPARRATEEENEMLADFMAHHAGRLPFANMRGPSRRGRLRDETLARVSGSSVTP